MPNFLEALRSRVKFLAPELAEVYIGSSPPGAILPLCIINRLWEDPILNISDEGSHKEVRLQFTILSFSDVEVESMGRSIYLGLWPKLSNPSLTFNDGYEIGRDPDRFIGPTDKLDDVVDTRKVWRTMFDYTWRVGVHHV